MTLQTLDLEDLHLALPSEHLKLQITSTVEFRFPSGWCLPRGVDCIADALTLGHVWVSRGRRCRLDVELFFDGKKMEGPSRIILLESLGYQLRNLHLWSQLALLPTLNISSQVLDLSTDLSIYIANDSTIAQTQPRAWVLDNVDIKAPESVLCAEFERLRLRMSFQQVKRRSRLTSKRLKASLLEPGCLEPMLLGDGSGLGEEMWPALFEDGMGVWKAGEGLKARGAKGLKTNEAELSSRLEEEMLLSLNDVTPEQQDKTKSGEHRLASKSAAMEKLDAKSQQFKLLKSWASTHPGNLYPTANEKLELMKETGLRRTQVKSWFGRFRLINKKVSQPLLAKSRPLIPPQDSSGSALIPEETVSLFENGMLLGDRFDRDEDDMLFGEDHADEEEDDMLFGEDHADEEEDEKMLFPQKGSTDPSLISQSATLSTSSSNTSLKRSASDDIFYLEEPPAHTTLLPKPVGKLACVAFCTLVAGTSTLRKDLQGAKIRKPPPSVALSLLMPSMFCPGFKEAMAHNSKFLPTISNAITSSCVRNVQGVGLRSKLMELSNASISEFHQGGGNLGSVERLTNVIRGRVWRLMQRTLYDQGSTRKLWKKSEDIDTEPQVADLVVCEDLDLLGEIEGSQCMDLKQSLEDFIAEDFEDDDEDLFKDFVDGSEDAGISDGDLLGYLEEQERLAIEAETDEMLFESNRCHAVHYGVHDEGADEESLLLGFGSQEEGMLL